jgi:hypothetical protein
MKKNIPLLEKACPFTLEVRYTRAEAAPHFYELGMKDEGIENVRYGDDTHTLLCEITKINRTPHMI